MIINLVSLFIKVLLRVKSKHFSHDISSIPQILHKIQTNWQDSTTRNRRNTSYLCHFLTRKARSLADSRSNRETYSVDLLIIGDGHSFWVGKFFSRALKLVFPLLKIQATSAKRILKLQDSMEKLRLDEDSLVLAITASGQTFSTLKAIELFNDLASKGSICELFVLTKNLSSLINSTSNGDRNYRRRIFTTGSDYKTAEANTVNTVAVAAAIATLNELLFYLAKQIKRNFPHCQPLEMMLTTQSLEVWAKMKADFVDNAVEIIGTDIQGRPIRSPINQELVWAGRHWGNYIIETPLAWVIFGSYVLISMSWIVLNHDRVSSVVIVANIAVPWLCTLAIAGRPLLARTSKRRLLIKDFPWINQLLTAYARKLFSSSYCGDAIEVYGVNPQDYLPYKFKYRTVNRTLVLLGVPDVAISSNPVRERQGFIRKALVIDSNNNFTYCGSMTSEQEQFENLIEICFGSFKRLLAGYIFFQAVSQKVASFPIKPVSTRAK